MTRSDLTGTDPRHVVLEVIEVPAHEESPSWQVRGLARLADGGSVLLRFGEQPSTAALIARAKSALGDLVERMRDAEALPADSYVEVDEESYGTPTAPQDLSRFLLPHQDGAHSSFLTPRAANDEHGITKDRIFSDSVYFKRPSHKMYQGFLITHPGTRPGETYYYDLVAMLFDSYARRFGEPPRAVEHLERFLGSNIARALELKPVHRSRYLTLGSLLGSPDPAHHVLPSGPRAESELWPEQYASIPGIWAKVAVCECGECTGPGARLMCHSAASTLGLSWPQLRRRYEVSVVGERGDLLIGNNLTQMHAAFSSRDRQICPVCIVVDKPAGESYERWLGDQWDRSFARLEAAA